jgi:hypothetical protein
MKTFTEFLEAQGETPEEILSEKKWIQGAVNPKHKGFCTPMTKKTCTPRRKALAKRFKKGDIHKANLEKDSRLHEGDEQIIAAFRDWLAQTYHNDRDIKDVIGYINRKVRTEQDILKIGALKNLYNDFIQSRMDYMKQNFTPQQLYPT